KTSPRLVPSALACATLSSKNGSARLTSDISIHHSPGRPSTTTASTGNHPLRSHHIIFSHKKAQKAQNDFLQVSISCFVTFVPFCGETCQGVLPKLCRQK